MNRRILGHRARQAHAGNAVLFSAFLILLSAVSISATAIAAETAEVDRDTPAWLQPEVLKAALAMQLDESQRPLFRTALTETLTGLQKNTRKLLRQNNTTHLKRKLKTSVRRQLNKMDKKVAKFLRADQTQAYEQYRGLLQKHLQAARLGPPKRATNEHEDGIGTQNPDWH